MKKRFGEICIGVSIFYSLIAGFNSKQARDTAELLEMFSPGLVFLMIGLKLERASRPQVVGPVGSGDSETTTAIPDSIQSELPAGKVRADDLKFNASLGVGCGIPLMFLGSAIARDTERWLLIGSLMLFGCFALEIWGSVNYVRWKGYSGWFGLFGYLLLPGLLILLCFPNRRQRVLRNQVDEPKGQTKECSDQDWCGYKSLLTLVPLALVGIAFASFLFWKHSSIAAAEWTQIGNPGIGFRALMPGSPITEQQSKDTPAGKIELRKFTVKPSRKQESFMIVWFHFPDEVSRQLGGTSKILDLGRQDVVAASQGRVKTERPIVLGGVKGLEIEVLPPKGAVVKSRIYATGNHLYEFSVYTSRMRITSKDVAKFFDSMEFLGESSPAQ